MISSNGRKRVIVTNISPQVQGGQFPAKAVVEEELTVSADIFSDGHDELAACLFLRKKSEKQWQQISMALINNDHWESVIRLPQIGFYQFKIEAWIDHFTTWKKGLRKKFDAGQDIHVDLLIGARLLRKAAGEISAPEKNQLLQWAGSFETAGNDEANLELVFNPRLAEIMYAYRETEFITQFPAIYEIEAERKKAGFSSWYELFPRSASPEPGKHGTFNDVKQLLPRIARMGFDVLYFPPIHPIGEVKRKGRNNSLTAGPNDPGSPWAIGNRLGGHKAIHPELGTVDDFKSLIADAKKLNIEIALDIAYQCAPDHPYVKEHPQWFNWRPDGTVQYAENPPKKYEDILPFNFETEDWENLWKELKSVLEYWIEQGITIFRIDNPHTKSLHFWEWVIREIRAAHPEIIFLAEAFTRPRIMERLAKAGFNQSYTYFAWRNTKYEIEQYMKELTRTEMRYYFRPNFWPNTPDILPAELVHGGENAHIMRLILAATLSSNYGIYGPVYEFGINLPHPGKEEYTDNEKYEIKHWDWDKYTRIKEIITRINRIRKENTALQSTWNIEFAETSNDQIICYTKQDHQTGNILIIAVNLDVLNTQSAYVKIPVEKLGIRMDEPYPVNDLLSGGKYHWQGEWNFVQLNPWQMAAHIFKVEQ